MSEKLMLIYDSWLLKRSLRTQIIFITICRFLVSAKSERSLIKAQKHDMGNIEAIKEKGLRILLVDDEERFRRAMARYLRSQFKTDVRHVGSGRAAIQEFEKGNPYDVVFLDLMMPDLTGVQTYLELKKKNVTSRIVFMSAHSNSEEWEKAEQLGLDPIAKPITDEKFAEIFSEL